MCKGVLMGINWLNVCIIISNNAGKRTSAKMQAETTKCVHQSENSTLSSRTCSESEPVGQRLDPHPWNSSRHPWLLECFYISNNLLYDRISPYAPGLRFGIFFSVFGRHILWQQFWVAAPGQLPKTLYIRRCLSQDLAQRLWLQSSVHHLHCRFREPEVCHHHSEQQTRKESLCPLLAAIMHSGEGHEQFE